MALPFGLTYMAILSPLLYWWVFSTRKIEILLPFLVFLSPFMIIHFSMGTDVKSYLVSGLNYTAVYIFCQAFYTFLKFCNEPDKIFNRLLIVNFLLCLLSVAIYFTSYDSVMWMKNSLTGDMNDLKRLKMFTYEASHYATMFIPLLFYFLFQLILNQQTRNSLLLLAMISLPMLLSFSFGVIISSLLAFLATYLFHFNILLRKKRLLVLLSIMAVVLIVSVLAMWIFYPQSSVLQRLDNILAGNDTSGNGRTTDAFILAWKILQQKSMAFGIGPGQIKLLGADIIRSYYLYDLDYNIITIPNAAAETLAIFGYVGLAIRLFIQAFLFYYCRVWTNYFRMVLFLFVFLYQFTGSYITNMAEYVIWIMAFTNAFQEFDIRPVYRKIIPNTQIGFV